VVVVDPHLHGVSIVSVRAFEADVLIRDGDADDLEAAHETRTPQ